MINELDYDNRQVLPRWFLYHSHCELLPGNPVGSEQPSSSEMERFLNALRHWRTKRSPSFAIELAAAAEIAKEARSQDVAEARSFLVAYASENPILDKLLSLESRESESEMRSDGSSPGLTTEGSRSIIAHAKERLLLFPDDPIAWIDLAYLYTIQGLTTKARRCVEVATGLTLFNPNILRFASRFYIHLGQPDLALALLRSSEIINKDPRLVSCEIAISEAFGLKSKQRSEAKRMIQSSNYSKRHLSELFATLSTLEFNAGNSGKGKRLIRSALAAPNENTLAQAEFLENKFAFEFDPKTYDIPCKFEALSWDSYAAARYSEALEQSRQWYLFQPFTSRPVMLSSYLASVIFSEDRRALSDLEVALRVSPRNSGMLNNKAFCLARLGKVDEATKALATLGRQSIEPDERAVITATTGLIQFRKKNVQKGMELYETAIQYFTSKGDNTRAARAYYFYGMELLSIDKERARKVLNQSLAIAKKGKIKDVLYLLERNGSVLAEGNAKAKPFAESSLERT